MTEKNVKMSRTTTIFSCFLKLFESLMHHRMMKDTPIQFSFHLILWHKQILFKNIYFLTFFHPSKNAVINWKLFWGSVSRILKTTHRPTDWLTAAIAAELRFQDLADWKRKIISCNGIDEILRYFKIKIKIKYCIVLWQSCKTRNMTKSQPK